MIPRIITIVVAIIAVVTASSCNSNTANKIKSDTLKVSNITLSIKSIAIDTINKMGIIKEDDSVVVDNISYKITTKPNVGDGGELIKVYNKVTKQTFILDEEDNFVSLDDDYLITEGGTTVNNRSFSVYDLNTSKMVFSSNYEAGLNIENNIIGFKIGVTITDPAIKPKCNPQQNIPLDNLGYIEQQYYDLKDKKLRKTGEYECWYFE